MASRGKSLKVRASDLRPRLSGFSVFPPNVEFTFPEPGPDERDIARRLLAYLEDRRVLYNPDSLEVPHHCVESVLDIRRELTRVLGDLDESSGMAPQIRAMRAACRKFLETSDGPDGLFLPRGGWHDWVFGSALGELRGVMGVAIAAVAERQGLDVEPPLSTILPAEPTDAD